MGINNTITKQKLDSYFDVGNRAIKKVKIAAKTKKDKAIAEDFLDMAKRYYKDAQYFYKNKDYVTAFAALNYAHGWLDAGSRSGLFDVDNDSKLFVIR